MNGIKTTFIICTALFIGFNNVIKAQEADQKIGLLINNSDWFTLEEKYPILRDEMQSEMLKKLSEAMTGLYFNRPEAAMKAIDWLLTNAQEEIGFDNTSNLILAKCMTLSEQGRYEESIEILEGFLEQISAFADLNQFPAHLGAIKHYSNIFMIR